MSGAHATLADWMAESHLLNTATGALALVGDSSENFDPGTAGFTTLSLGAARGHHRQLHGHDHPRERHVSGRRRRWHAAPVQYQCPHRGQHRRRGQRRRGHRDPRAEQRPERDDHHCRGDAAGGGNGSTTGSLDSTSDIVANGTLAFNRSDTVTFSLPVSGTGGITQAGTGILILNGGSNTYATTAINRGTLRLGANNTLPTTGALTIGTSGAAGTAGTFDMSTFSQTVGSLSFRTTISAVTNTITIGTGQTLTVNGAFNVGVAGQSGITTKAIISGAGTLNVNNTATNFEAGIQNADQNTTQNVASLDMSGLANFSANVNEFRVGYGSQIGTTLKLASTSNTITANVVQISNTINNNAQACFVTFGNGTNVIATDTMNIAVSKGVATMNFASQAAGSPGTLVIGGKSGTKTNFIIANSAASSTGATPTATLDFRGHNTTITAGSGDPEHAQ
ncbi:MAG: hypothetical protein WDN28_17075 [Chthoniobacter sp.]